MTVCYFGTYEKDYPRNRIIIEGLRKAGVRVAECHVDIWGSWEHKTNIKKPLNLLKLLFKFIVAYATLPIRYYSSNAQKAAIIMVGYPGHFDMFMAYMLAKIGGKKLLFNPLISLYDTIVMDRRMFKQNGIMANGLLSLEKSIFGLADGILIDTKTHETYLRDLLSIADHIKTFVVYVGADEHVFRYNRYISDGKKLRVLFYGKFTPLHGIPTILEAATLLEKNSDIEFTIIGKGQLSRAIEEKKKSRKYQNVTFIDWVPLEKLGKTIAGQDVCLGIFDVGKKAQNVIPNKVFQALAVGRAVITADTAAIKELFKNKENILLVNPGSGDELASMIKKIAHDNNLLQRIAENGHFLLARQLTAEKIGITVTKALAKMS